MKNTNEHLSDNLQLQLEQAGESALLLTDCRSNTECDVMDRWLQGNVRGTGVNPETQQLTLDLSQLASAGTLERHLESLDDQTLILPMRVLWLPAAGQQRLRDLLLGNPHNPGWLQQKLILNFNPDRCSPIHGDPATLGQLRIDYADHAEQQTLGEFVQRRAVLAMKQVERKLRGHRYKEPAFVENDILHDPEFRQDLAKISSKNNTATRDLAQEAQGYIKELVPTSTPLGLDLLIRLSRYVYTRGYDREIVIDSDQVEKLRALSREHPVVLLCNHRSQVDSFAIYSALYDNDLPHPHTFGGINMKWPIIGNIQRSSGMIFIRRAFNDNPVYKAVLQRYIDYLVSRRFPLLWSIEGGRSRTGKLIPPRYGLLNWLLNAAERFDRSQPLYIVPLSVVFEQVIDVKAYAHEQRGGVKKPENLSWFYQYLNSFKTPLGKIHIRFGDPVQARVDAGQPRDPIAVERLAFETCVELNRSTPVTMASLICGTLLAGSPQALTHTELCRELDTLLAYLRATDCTATFSMALSAEELLQAGLPQLISSSVVHCFEAGLEPVYNIVEDKALDAAYYRNNAIHYLFTGAIADIALAKLYLEGVGDNPLQELEQQILQLRKLLQWEFFFPEKDQFLTGLYRDLDIRHPNWRDLILQGKGGLHQLFLELSPLLGHGALEPYLEAYRIVSEQLLNCGQVDAFDQKAFIDDCLNIGKQLYLQRQIVSPESIAKAMFDTGLKVAKSQGLLDISVSPSELSNKRQQHADEMRAISRQVRALRSLASARRAGILGEV
ncbi:MAG: 1-acyl-sn-glycerol-3-phosphate acyltransferase [Halioglobus sp.]